MQSAWPTRPCSRSQCRGSGIAFNKTCLWCRGTGKEYAVTMKCYACRSSGRLAGGTCPACQGEGTQVLPVPLYSDIEWQDCFECRGSGREGEDVCKICGGVGVSGSSHQFSDASKARLPRPSWDP